MIPYNSCLVGGIEVMPYRENHKDSKVSNAETLGLVSKGSPVSASFRCSEVLTPEPKDPEQDQTWEQEIKPLVEHPVCDSRKSAGIKAL